MKTNLTARNLELDDRLRSQIERKLKRLDRITHDLAEADVELIAQRVACDRQRPGGRGHAAQPTETSCARPHPGATPIAALDIVLDKLERQVVRTKERPRSVRERHSDEVDSVLAREALGTLDSDDGAELTAGPTVVKIEALRHAADVRGGRHRPDGGARTRLLRLPRRRDDRQVAVLYRRADGNYGVIQPVIDRGAGGSR